MALKKEIEEKVETKEEASVGMGNSEAKGDEAQDIEVNDPMVLRPVELPLVVKLPAGASKAQIAYAATLNGYAYKNPEKWAQKKDDKMVGGVLVKGLITKLRDLKNAPDPVEGNLKVNKSAI